MEPRERVSIQKIRQGTEKWTGRSVAEKLQVLNTGEQRELPEDRPSIVTFGEEVIVLVEEPGRIGRTEMFSLNHGVKIGSVTEGQKLKIGRDTDANIKFGNDQYGASVSRNHGSLERKNGKITLTDSGMNMNCIAVAEIPEISELELENNKRTLFSWGSKEGFKIIVGNLEAKILLTGPRSLIINTGGDVGSQVAVDLDDSGNAMFDIGKNTKTEGVRVRVRVIGLDVIQVKNLSGNPTKISL